MRCKGKDGALRWHWKTGLASPYPVALSRDVAKALEEAGPRCAFTVRGEVAPSPSAHHEIIKAFESGQSRSQRGQRELLEANKEWPPPIPQIPPLPAVERRSWPKGSEAWGRHIDQ